MISQYACPCFTSQFFFSTHVNHKINYRESTQPVISNPVLSQDEGEHEKSLFSRHLRGLNCRSNLAHVIPTFLKCEYVSHPFRHCCICYILGGQNFYNFMNRFIFVNPFQNEKDLNGLPKIALRKSKTKTYKKICGLWLNLNFLVGVCDF